MVYLVRSRPGIKAVPALLLRLINTLKKYGMNEKAEKYKKILSKKYPGTQEAYIAGVGQESG